MKRAKLNTIGNQQFDIIIIGGGITGASAARDAALRGLSTLLLEKSDFAAGTSSRSTKLLHGGVRYLQHMEFKLVLEAVRERELFVELAPHLSNIMPFIFLCYQGIFPGMLPLHAGLTLYDLFSGNPGERAHKMVWKKKLLEIEPNLNPEGLKGGGWYYDSYTDDARLTLDVLKGACEAGAEASNHMGVIGFTYGADGQMNGVKVKDYLTGEEGEVKGRKVLNATGVWGDQVRFFEEGQTSRIMSPAKGIHIVVRKSDFPLNNCVFLPSPDDKRVTWPIPSLYDDLVYIGTTDTFYDESLDHVVAKKEDIDYLLNVANFTIPEANLGYEHIVSTWAGLRPLVKPEGELAASKVSREHQLFTSPSGMITIAGGKMTTARVMGRDMVTAAMKQLGYTDIPETTSAEVPISGGDMASDFDAQANKVADEVGMSEDVADRLKSMYGANFFKIADIMKTDPEAKEDFGDGHNVTRAEVRYGVTEEMAMTLTDFMDHRASRFYWSEDGGRGIASKVMDEMAAHLDWDEAEKAKQFKQYNEWVAANRVPVEEVLS